MHETSRPAVPDTASSPPPERLPGYLTACRWLLLATVVGATLILCLHPIEITDFWWQAKTGALIVHTGQIPTRDVFSWTSAGEPWQVHEWLTEVAFYGLTFLPRDAWLLLKCGLGAVAVVLVLARAHFRCGLLPLAAAGALTAAHALKNYADLRPQMITFVLLAGLLLGLDRYRAGRSRLLPWLLPGLFILWSNLHGGVVVGLGLVGIWLAGEFAGDRLFGDASPGLGRLAAGWAAAAVAVGLNPHGYEVYLYPLKVLGHPQVADYIVEWYSPNFHWPRNAGFEILLLGAPAAAAIGRLAATRAGASAPIRLGEWGVLLVMAHAALLFDRNTVPFALAAAPMLCEGIALAIRYLRVPVPSPVPAPARAVITVLAAALAAGVGLRHLPREVTWTGSGRILRPSEWSDYGTGWAGFPHAAVERMRAGAWPGRLYNDYVWGGYLIWTLHPDRPVFIDGRAEVYYRTGAFDAEMKIHQLREGWDRELDRWRVDVVLTRIGGGLDRALRQHPGWERVFTGPVEAVYLRRRAGPDRPPARG